MRRQLIPLILILVCVQSFSQKIYTDIFDNLVYESTDGYSKSYLKKNIFDDLVYSDNMGNEITIKKKYIDFQYSGLLKNKEEKLKFFLWFIHEHCQDRNYKASFSVDIFDKIIIEDNRNRKLEIGKDLFGNETYNDIINAEMHRMKRNLNGGLEYRSKNEDATLQKDGFVNWKYNDSSGNEFKFSNETWRRLKIKFDTEEKIFQHLISEYLNSSCH